MIEKINIIKQKIDNYLNAPLTQVETERQQGYREALIHVRNEIIMLDLKDDINQFVQEIENKYPKHNAN